MTNIILRQQFQLSPKRKIVTPETTTGEFPFDHFENIDYDMVQVFHNGGFTIHWYGEDETEMYLEEYLKLKVSGKV